jgi:hypothetical protein
MQLPASASTFGDKVENPLLKKLFEYWLELVLKDGLARKARFDPTELPKDLWPRLFMVDVQQAHPKYCFRLLGTYAVDALGEDLTGRHLVDEEIPGISGSITLSLMEKLSLGDEPRPQHFIGAPTFARTIRFDTHEQLILPLFDQSDALTAGVGAVNYTGFLANLFRP